MRASVVRWIHVLSAVCTVTVAVASSGCSEEMNLDPDGGLIINGRDTGVITPPRDGNGPPPGVDVPNPTRCTMNSQCDDGRACTADECNNANGTCINRPDLTRCECDPSCTNRNSGMGGMWSDPGRNGVEYDMASGGLIVRAQARRSDYLWVPNTGESTVSKWDATMNREVARYRVGLAAGECRGQCCYTPNCNQVSRVVVDGRGNAYAAARGFSMQGTVTKLASERVDCIDRNMNGSIETSSGPMNVLPYGADECVMWTANVGPVNAVLRSLAIDRGDENYPEGYPWVGGCANTGGLVGGAGLWQLNPRNGMTIRPLAFAPCAYGAVVTPDGTLWEHTLSNGISPVNTSTGAIGTLIRAGTGASPTTGQSYGVTADARGRIWLSRPGARDAVGYDPMGRTWSIANLGAMGAATAGLGITVDPTNHVWVPANNALYTWEADAFVANGAIPAARITRHMLTVPAGWSSTSAIGADRSGAIWVATQQAGPLLKYDPVTRMTQSFAGPNQVYTYTDFTGAVRRLVIGEGTYSENYMAECEMPQYADLRWESTTPMGTSLQFSVQVANTEAGLTMAPSVPIAVAPRDMSPVAIGPKLMMAGIMTPGRFARVTVRFVPTLDPVQTPVLRSLGLSWRCGVNPG